MVTLLPFKSLFGSLKIKFPFYKKNNTREGELVLPRRYSLDVSKNCQKLTFYREKIRELELKKLTLAAANFLMVVGYKYVYGNLNFYIKHKFKYDWISDYFDM